MNRAIVIFLLLVSTSFISNAENAGKKTIYFDADYSQVSDKSKATYYCIINIVDGKIDNPCSDYYMSGVMHWKGDVISYELNSYITNGVCTWYDEDGKKQYQVTVASNVWNGKFRAWWPNGSIKEKSNYVNGKKDGCEYKWDENGKCISGQLAVIDEEYKQNPNDPKYKINCDCTDKTAPAVSAPVVNTPVVSSDGNYYGTGLVRDRLNDNLSGQESVLFKLLDDSKHGNPLVFLNFNFHEANENDQKVANTLYYGLINTKSFERIFSEKYNEHLNEAIYYSIGYSNIFVNIAEVDKQMPEGTRITWLAVVSFNVWVRNDKGEILLNETFKGETNKMILGSYTGFSYATQDEALKHSVDNLQNRITKYFRKEFTFN